MNSLFQQQQQRIEQLESEISNLRDKLGIYERTVELHWMAKIKSGAKFKDKHGNVYFLEKRNLGLFGDGNDHYYIKCSEMDKGRGECMFQENSISISFRFLGMQKFVLITQEDIEFI